MTIYNRTYLQYKNNEGQATTLAFRSEKSMKNWIKNKKRNIKREDIIHIGERPVREESTPEQIRNALYMFGLTYGDQADFYVEEIEEDEEMLDEVVV